MHIIVDAWLNIYTYTHRRILDLLVMCISTMEKMLRGIRLRKQGWDLLASKRGRMSIKTGIKINIDSGITSTGSWWIATWGASQKITGEFHALWISTVSYIPCINHILALGIIQEKTIIMHVIYPKKEPASKTSGGNIIYGDASNYSCWVHDERHISDKTCSVTTKQKKTQTNYQDLTYRVERTVQTFTVMKQLQRWISHVEYFHHDFPPKDTVQPTSTHQHEQMLHQISVPFNFFCLDTFLVWNQLWHLALPIPSTSLGSEDREAHVNQQLCLHVAYSIALSQSKELCAERSGSQCHRISQNQASTHTYIAYGVHI